MVIVNIVEVAPRALRGEDVTINYFCQLFPVCSAGKNLYDCLQEGCKKTWGFRFHAEAMDLEQSVRKCDEARLRTCMENVVLEHKYEITLDDFGPKHYCGWNI